MVYAFATLSVTDSQALAAYRDKAGAALEKHGGKVESASGDLSVLEGDPALPNVAALLSFPDNEAALAWANDPDLSEVHALRRRAGASEIVLLG